MGLEFKKNVKGLSHEERLYNKYKLLALNIFKWENLPNNIESRHIEKALYNYGQAVFFEDKDLGYILLGANSSGNVNIYNESKSVIATGVGYSKVVNLVNAKDSIYKDSELMKNNCFGVRVCNNDLMLPLDTYVRDYAQKMYNVENAINLNIEQQKFPYFINTNKNTEFTLKTMFDKIKNGAYAIFGNKNINLDDIQVLNLQTPYVADKLNHYKYELEREILTFFGLNNNYEKKERLLVDEVNSNNDYINRNVDLMLKCREEFCKQVNEIYGLQISVTRIGGEDIKTFELEGENYIE